MLKSALIILVITFAIFLAIAIKDVIIKRKIHNKYNIRRVVSAYVMLLPAVVLAFLFILLPILYSLGYAFTDFYLLKPNEMKIVWFKNFSMLFKELREKGDIYYAFRNTAKFVVGVVPLQIGLALGLALLVHKKRTAVGIFKVAYFAPVVISLTVTSYLWLQILAPSESGMMNSLLKIFGLPAQDFLRNTKSAMSWIIVMSAWQGAGYQMLIFLSGLTNIRKELYEAASLDGAGWWRLFINITCPSLRSTFMFIIITVFVGACRIMIQPMLLTGYQMHTVTLSYYMYMQGYTYRWVGYSSAVALMMTIIIGSITLLQRKLLREKD